MNTAPALNSTGCKISARYFSSLGGSDAKRASCLRVCSFMKWPLGSWNFNRERVKTVTSFVINPARQAADQTNAPATGMPLIQARLGVRAHVERAAIVDNPQAKAFGQALDAEGNAMIELIVVAVLDDVGAHFLNCQLGVIKRLWIGRVLAEKFTHAFNRPHEGRQRVWKRSLPGLSRRRIQVHCRGIVQGSSNLGRGVNPNNGNARDVEDKSQILTRPQASLLMSEDSKDMESTKCV